MNRAGALAIFVKTPELSPVKTRLSVGIGEAGAKRFYELSVAATAAVARAAQGQIGPGIEVFWAVAEDAGVGCERWKEFAQVAQGGGGLGQKLSSVYSGLLRDHKYVCCIGADSPHLPVDQLVEAFALTANLSARNFILGQTEDGGFYFFAGGRELPESVWTSVEYSSNKTAGQLVAALEVYAPVVRIESGFDIDTIDDLRRYQSLNAAGLKLLPEQIQVLEWSKGYF